jgi:choline-sulfatase
LASRGNHRGARMFDQRIALVIAAVTLSVSCTPESQQEPLAARVAPDILLVTIDTLRADRVGAYGDPLAQTPQLDALAAESALFTSAWTVAPLTMPAHTSLLTGLYPYDHGVHDNGMIADEQLNTIAERLQGSGYRTGGFVSAYVLDSAFGLEQGFDHYEDDFHPEEVGRAVTLDSVQRPARETVRAALAWWRKQSSPRFMWVHLFEPHAPYAPSADWSGSDPYRGEVFDVDRALRPLLLEVGDSALVVVVGDHGESLWDEGEADHANLLTRSSSRVPLIIRPPDGSLVKANDSVFVPLPKRPSTWAPVPSLMATGLELDVQMTAPVAGLVVEQAVSIVDIAPTILDYAGTENSERSLRGVLQGTPGPRNVVQIETRYPARHYGWEEEFVVFDGEYWLRMNDGLSLYAVSSDPWLISPLEEKPSPSLIGALSSLSSVIDDTLVDPQTAQQLAALGYQTAQIPTEVGGRARTKIGILHELSLANRLVASMPSHAIGEIEGILEREPMLLDGWSSLGLANMMIGDVEAALRAYTRAVALAPTDVMTNNNHLIALRALGRHEEVSNRAQELMMRYPTDTRWVRLAVNANATLERMDAVQRISTLGLVQDAADPYLLYMLGLAEIQRSNFRLAVTALDAAVSNGTRAVDVQMWLGHAHQALGNVDLAVTAYSAASRDNPSDIRPVVAAGMLLSEERRCDEASSFLHHAVVGRGVTAESVVTAYRQCGGR